MNERIKELAKQAGFHIELNWDHTDWHSAGHSPLFEKFAELIVKECVKIALDERVSEEIDESNDIEDRCYLRGNNGGIVDAVVAIKQHFGV